MSDANLPIVHAGSKWTTRGPIPRRVTVITIADNSATVRDDASGEIWHESTATVESWTRRASSGRHRAVKLVEAFVAFLSTDSAKAAPPWQLHTLARVEWPGDMHPTVDTYRGLLRALELTETIAEPA